jgi:hypothetical protein
MPLHVALKRCFYILYIKHYVLPFILPQNVHFKIQARTVTEMKIPEGLDGQQAIQICISIVHCTMYIVHIQ